MKSAIRAKQMGSRTSWFQLFASKGNRQRIAKSPFHLPVIIICSMRNLSGSAIVGGYYIQILDLVGITSPASRTGINGGLTIAVIAGAILGLFPRHSYSSSTLASGIMDGSHDRERRVRHHG
ncbi:BQ2448_7682 [Microbotryum intermedium]|uniref:BQ2448_7682 protein n=1 Tax=Microbotryum intermedium TaxID=269621 RepID=A0A238FRR3_9BASI|nr:BQ2448_7682 [Microbotryum intermedium]